MHCDEMQVNVGNGRGSNFCSKHLSNLKNACTSKYADEKEDIAVDSETVCLWLVDMGVRIGRQVCVPLPLDFQTWYKYSR